MGGCLFQGTGRCIVWMVNDLCLLSRFLCLCHPYIPLNIYGMFSVHLYYSIGACNTMNRWLSSPLICTVAPYGIHVATIQVAIIFC